MERKSAEMKLTIVGCGDAFGSGGRLQTCYHVETGSDRFLIDCGASVLIGLNRLKLDPNPIETVFLSHLHGDHYAGLVWWLLHAHHVSHRTTPLTVVGPPGTAERTMTTSELLFPGSTSLKRRHELTFVEYQLGIPLAVGPHTVTAYPVKHPSGAPSCGLRIEAAGKILSFSGDTEWVEELVACAAGADLYITECYSFAREVPYHQSWRILTENLPRLTAARIIITHMNDEMLAHRAQASDPRVIHAEDGLVIEM
jgi:ribonuclease BN (tRNA processing enzyme)